MARLDRLGTAKDAAQNPWRGPWCPSSRTRCCSAVAGMPDKHLEFEALEQLVRSGLLFRRGVHPLPQLYLQARARSGYRVQRPATREPRRALHARFVQQARLLLEQIKANSEGSHESPLLPFSVLYSSWVANLVAFDSVASCDLATAEFTAARRRAEGDRTAGRGGNKFSAFPAALSRQACRCA